MGDPAAKDPYTGLNGDGDPVDVVCLSSRVVPVGEVMPVRVVGTLAMIDDGETDWKVLAVPAAELAQAGELANEAAVDAVRHWFRFYKTTDGKPENSFAFDAKLLDEDMTFKVIAETANSYAQLVEGRHAASKDFAIASP